MFLGSRARPALKADKLTAICEPIVVPCCAFAERTSVYRRISVTVLYGCEKGVSCFESRKWDTTI
jgi:hypothetical protein